MKKGKRFAFKCWSCDRNYTLFREITKEQELIVRCPYCNAEAVAKLKPYQRKKKHVMKGNADQDQAVGFEYDFPDVLPTQKPAE